MTLFDALLTTMTEEKMKKSAAEAVPLDKNSMEMSDNDNDESKIELNDPESSDNGPAQDHIESTATIVDGIQYRDHFSLKHPSSTVRFRSSATSYRVYQGNNSQFVLEQTQGNEITVKRVRDVTSGSMFLRAVYTVVTVLWSGFLFVFCTQLLIFLVMDLVVNLGGTTGSNLAVGRAVGTILSLPLYVSGLASALIIAGHFIADTWAGMYLIKNLVFGGVRSVMAAWITFCFYLGFPLLVMGSSLLAGTPDWWSITAIFWFSSISVFYVLFAAIVIYVEVAACLEIVAHEYGYNCGSKRALLARCILLRQVQVFSGQKSRIYLARGTLHSTDSLTEPIAEESVRNHETLYSRFTKWPILQKIGMIEPLDEPGQRIYPIEESSGVRPFITYTTWTLDKLYCKPKNSWFVAVIKGPAALSRNQINSSFACSAIGTLLVWFLVIAFLVWFDFSGGVVAIVIVIMAILSIPNFLATMRIYRMTKDVEEHLTSENDTEGQVQHQSDMETSKEDDEQDTGISLADSEGLFQVCETYRITQASNRYCWTMFILEIGLLYLWPLVSLYVVNDAAIGTIFLFIGLFSLVRYFLNAAVVLEEVGNMKSLRGKDKHAKWKNQSRTNDIVTNISRSRSRGPWIIVLVFFLVIAMVLGIGALSQNDPQEGDGGYNVTFVPGFRYERVDNSLPYPTCSLDFNVGQGPIATRDFVFLSTMAYEANTTKLQEQLDSWFGTNVAIDTPDLVETFRNETKRDLSPVTYKLYSFPNITSAGEPVAVVAVRGSQNAYDWLTNAQLWSAAYGMQILRSFLPFGFIWNPIFDELVRAVSIVESASIKRVSYYKETSDFVRWLQESGLYADVKITGHSLGGGLAIITSSQTRISGIAVSGPNALLIRKTLEPPVTEDDLDTFTFNLIPDRDIVPTAGGVAKHFENLQCRSAPNDPFGCHDVLRTLCELLFTCGTDDRPAICQCVTEYNYPQPISTIGASFAEACGF